MRRSPLRRGAPLARTSRLRPRRATPRRSARVRDEDYLAAVRALPCYVCLKAAPSDPDHMGERPFGRKADDSTAVPLCRECHGRRTDGFAPTALATAGWGCPRWERTGKAAMRAWCDAAIVATQLAVARARLGGVPW